ncbi:MAG: type II CRISPR RNA-guided endonuclease Cas9 [Clostridia bacterium]|nr:type II CRISPR RNA-guided endonuclease Cas9 [Clostridia bacterium]
MKYRLGLDIGIASVGWSVVQCDDFGEPQRIVDLGVRTFDAAEVPKTKASPAEERRLKRSARRRNRRRAHRLERVRQLCSIQFGKDIVENCHLSKDDLFELRYLGLDSKLQPSQITRLLIYFAKHRGATYLAKCKKDKDEKIRTLPSNYRTWGEMIFLDTSENGCFVEQNGKRVYNVRNHEENNNFRFSRDDIVSEVTLILNKQKEHDLVDDAFIQKYLAILTSQRSFDEGPSAPSRYHKEGFADLVGYCTYYSKSSKNPQLRAAKATYTQEYATALQKINNITIISNGEERKLTEEERAILYGQMFSLSEFKYHNARKALALPSESIFNITYSSKKEGEELAETEKKKVLFSMKNTIAIQKCLSEEHKCNFDLLDEIATILTHYKSDNLRKQQLSNLVTEEEIDKLLNLDPNGHGHLSVMALKQIIPYLEQGFVYSDACQKAGLSTLATSGEKMLQLKGAGIVEMINDINSPVVRRSVSQTIKVINAIVGKYGSPSIVNVELARDMSRTREERKWMDKQNQEFDKNRKDKLARLQNELQLQNPKWQDVVKFELYEQQQGKCAYSQQPLDLSRLFEVGYVEVDHIIPYSRCFDDSQSNKVLVLSKQNQDKRNRTPYEYLGQDPERWDRFVAYVNATYSSPALRKKKQNLLKKSVSAETEKEWMARNLNDTRYISRFIYNLIKDNLVLQPVAGKVRQVYAVNGRITDYCRKNWGLTKVRSEGNKHHALDATVIATLSQGTIEGISRWNQHKERYALWYNGKRAYTDPQTGELLTNDQYDSKFRFIPQPYDGFRDELILRLSDNPAEMIQQDSFYSAVLRKLNYTTQDIDPIFVSRMPNRKATGAIHKETKYSTRMTGSSQKYAKKTPLVELKVGKDGNILGYPQKLIKDDPLLYNALLERLKQFNNVAKLAFKEPFFKPKADGTPGNRVYKVYIEETIGSGVSFDNIKGFSQNASIVRVDVFTKKGKYYCVPVYTKHIYAKVLPNKAITAGKTIDQWDEMDDSYTFLFSLYSNDLICVEKKLKESNTYKTVKEFYYYKGIDVDGGRATIISHDNRCKERISIKTLKCLQKCQVDILGNVSFVDKETRLNTDWLK